MIILLRGGNRPRRHCPEGPARAERSAKFFARAAKQKLPPPFVASASLNAYLAAREAYLRHSARSVQKLRRFHATGQIQFVTHYVTNCLKTLNECELRIKKARIDAREIWARTRDPRSQSPYANILDRDATRLKAWRTWLNATAKNPARALDASPVHGRWQLSFIVHNRAPALQKILVEQQSADGSWKTLAERFTIEFRAKAARPRANIRREFSVSVDSPARPLRIALRGVGEVSVSHVTLTDGVITLQPKDWPVREHRALGMPAPSSGLPDLHLTSNRDQIALVF